MQPLKMHAKFPNNSHKRIYIKKPRSHETIITLNQDFRQRVEASKKFYFKLQLANTINRDPQAVGDSLRYYANRLRLCPNLKEIFISQVVLTNKNLQHIITLVKSIKRLRKIAIEINLSETLSCPLVEKLYRSLYKLKQLQDIRIFTSAFYRYPHNILQPLLSNPDLQARLKALELTITRELNEKRNGIFFRNLNNFKKIKDLTLDFTRANTSNMLSDIFHCFQNFNFLESLSLNLNGQYVPTEAYKNLAQSLTDLNIRKLSLVFKCSSTIGADLSMLLKACRRVSYLKLVFVEEAPLREEGLVPLQEAMGTLSHLRELYLDLSQTSYCNIILQKVSYGLAKINTFQKLFLKFNSNEDWFKTKGITMFNIRELLSPHWNLKSLDLHCSNSQGIKDRIGYLIQGIKQLKVLEYFSIYMHYSPLSLSDFSFRGLVQALAAQKRLKGLNIAVDSHRLTNNSLMELRESFVNRKSLEEIRLNMIKWKITEEGLEHLSEWILASPQLFKVEVIFQEAGSEEMARGLELEMSQMFPRHRFNVEYRK